MSPARRTYSLRARRHGTWVPLLGEPQAGRDEAESLGLAEQMAKEGTENEA